MRERLTTGLLALALTALALGACGEDEPNPDDDGPTYAHADDEPDPDREDPIVGGVAPDDPTPDPGAGGVGASFDSKLELLLLEVADQLEAGDWGPYLKVRAEVAAGLHVPELREALLADPSPAQRVAGVLLEDLLVAPLPPAGLDLDTHATLRQLAHPILATTLAAPDAGALRPLAGRILGRLPRGSSQTVLFERLDAETDPLLRLVVFTALGDNIGEEGAVPLQARFEDTSDCAEARVAAVAIRRAHEGLDAVDLRPWLGEVAAPRLVECAGLTVIAGDSPDADLLALTHAFDQAPGVTLVDEVLLPSGPSDDLKLQTLRVLRGLADPAAADALEAALPNLSGDVATEAAAVLAILKA